MVVKNRDPLLWLAPYLTGDGASYQEYGERLIRKLTRYFAANGCEAADDLASESLMRLTKKLADSEMEAVDSEESRTKFLFGIARIVLLEWRRRPSTREMPLPDDDRPEYGLPPVNLMAAECLELLRETVNEILKEFPSEQRDLLRQTVLNPDGRRSLNALARERDIREDAMRKKSSRARQRFVQRLLASSRIDDLLRCFGLEGLIS